MKFKSKLEQYEIVSITYDKWRDLTTQEVAQEYEWEYVTKPATQRWTDNAFPTLKDFEKAVVAGEVVTVTNELDRKIGFRSRTHSLEQLKRLVSGYRFPRDVDRIVKGLQQGDPIPYPIILRKDGDLRIMSGNTRLDVANILGVQAKVLIVDVPERVEGSRKKRYMEMFKPDTKAEKDFATSYVNEFRVRLEREDRIMWALRKMKDFYNLCRENSAKDFFTYKGSPKDPRQKEWDNLLENMQEIASIMSDADEKGYVGVKELRFKPDWSADQALEELRKAAEKEAHNPRHRSLPLDDDNETVVEFPDGWKWVYVDSAGSCSREGKAMHHCGNSDSHRMYDEIYSLREPIKVNGKEREKPHLTFILNHGFLTQMKGFGNRKPDSKFHKYIVEFLKQSFVKGIAGGGYGAVNNFSLDDLSSQEAEQLLQDKPTLDPTTYFKKHGIDKNLKSYLNDEFEDRLHYDDYANGSRPYLVIEDNPISSYYDHLQDKNFFKKEFPALNYDSDLNSILKDIEDKVTKVKSIYGEYALNAGELIIYLDMPAVFEMIASGEPHHPEDIYEELTKLPPDFAKQVLPKKAAAASLDLRLKDKVYFLYECKSTKTTRRAG